MNKMKKNSKNTKSILLGPLVVRKLKQSEIKDKKLKKEMKKVKTMYLETEDKKIKMNSIEEGDEEGEANLSKKKNAFSGPSEVKDVDLVSEEEQGKSSVVSPPFKHEFFTSYKEHSERMKILFDLNNLLEDDKELLLDFYFTCDDKEIANLSADEYKARISPFTKVEQLTEAEREVLYSIVD